MRVPGYSEASVLLAEGFHDAEALQDSGCGRTVWLVRVEASHVMVAVCIICASNVSLKRRVTPAVIPLRR